MNFFKKLFAKQFPPRTIVNISGTTTAVWPDRNYDNFARETYLKNVISFRCVDMISKSVASVKWKLMQTGKDGYQTQIVTHPIIDLMYRPNPYQGWTAFCKGVISYLVMSGNTYIRRTAPTTGPNRNIPKQMDSLRPDRVRVLVNQFGELAGFEYTVPTTSGVSGYTKEYLVDPKTGKFDVLQMKSFNPIDDNYGAAITESVAREVDTSNAATEWNKKLLDNEARPGMIITYNKNLSDEQYERLEKQIKTKYSGSANAGRNLILEGTDGAKVDMYGFSPADMDFIQGSQDLCRKIAMGYGVPSQLIGIPDSQTYGNYEQAREAFWDETVLFYLEFLKTELNNWFFEKDSNIELNYTLDGVPSYSSRQSVLWERARSSDFITINEKRELAGYEKIEGGDVVLVPMSSVPLGDTGIGTEELTPANEEVAKSKISSRGYNKDQVDSLFGDTW